MSQLASTRPSLAADRRVRSRRRGAERSPGVADSQRSVLARRLHDGIGQPLTALLMEIDRSREEGTAAADMLDRFERLTRSALNSARRTVLEVVAVEEDLDPLDAARDFSESTLAIGGCELVWETMPDLRDLPLATSRRLAVVIRESVTNIARHAAAHTISVRLVRHGDAVVVTVEDDGIGLDGQQVSTPGYGLRANMELARSLGGSFSIQPRFGGGTIVRFQAVVEADE